MPEPRQELQIMLNRWRTDAVLSFGAILRLTLVTMTAQSAHLKWTS